jgi:hypothetical protein
MSARAKLSVLAAAALFLAGAAPTNADVVASIDLSKPFHTRSAWRFTASQEADVKDPDFGEMVPGEIALCISKDGGRSCSPDLRKPLRWPGTDDRYARFDEPHYLGVAEIVHPKADRPFLLLQMASRHSVNGNQNVATKMFAYDRALDRFVPAFENLTGKNNNEVTRYMAKGPLAGDIVSAEPTSNSPYGYWVTVSRLGSASSYRQILRYRSATRYDDGNELSVIDSEMPKILQRLGLWHKGAPLPLPAGKCPLPRMIHGALWCT